MMLNEGMLGKIKINRGVKGFGMKDTQSKHEILKRIDMCLIVFEDLDSQLSTTLAPSECAPLS